MRYVQEFWNQAIKDHDEIQARVANALLGTLHIDGKGLSIRVLRAVAAKIDRSVSGCSEGTVTYCAQSGVAMGAALWTESF